MLEVVSWLNHLLDKTMLDLDKKKETNRSSHLSICLSYSTRLTQFNLEYFFFQRSKCFDTIVLLLKITSSPRGYQSIDVGWFSFCPFNKKIVFLRYITSKKYMFQTTKSARILLVDEGRLIFLYAGARIIGRFWNVIGVIACWRRTSNAEWSLTNEMKAKCLERERKCVNHSPFFLLTYSL